MPDRPISEKRLLNALGEMIHFLEYMLVGCSEDWRPDCVQSKVHEIELKLTLLDLNCDVSWDRDQQKFIYEKTKNDVVFYSGKTGDINHEFIRINEEIRNCLHDFDKYAPSRKVETKN